MRSSRGFELTGVLLSLIQSLLILSLFVESSSTVPTAAQTEKPATEYVTELSLVFPESKAISLATATSEQKENFWRKFANESEAFDMENSSESIANDALDPEGDLSTERPAAPASTTISDNSSTVSNASEPGNATTIDTVAANSTSPAISSIPTTTGAAPTTAAMTEAATTTTTTITTTTTTTTATAKTEATTTATIATAEPLTDRPDDAVATTLSNQSQGQGMPGGVVALVTIVTFVIIAVAAYIGLIVWRRYLEYRYSNRELLVNDLELDGNDLRNFEL